MKRSSFLRNSKEMLTKSFNPAKCKTSLKLASSRLKLLKNKKEVQVKQMKRELAQLLDSGQDRTARIRVEHVVREEKMMAAYDLIEIYCELIVARLPIIESQKPPRFPVKGHVLGDLEVSHIDKTQTPSRPFTRSQAKLIQDTHLHLIWKGMEEGLGSDLKTMLWCAMDGGPSSTLVEASGALLEATQEATAPGGPPTQLGRPPSFCSLSGSPPGGPPL